jgi:endonuclease/exonuclease/phosphatase family metal-dependent hydrolase
MPRWFVRGSLGALTLVGLLVFLSGFRTTPAEPRSGRIDAADLPIADPPADVPPAADVPAAATRPGVAPAVATPVAATRPADAKASVAASVAGARAATTTTTAPTRFALATLNIRRGRGIDERTDLARTADAVRGFDFVGLQEVGIGQDSDLARRLQMRSAFAPTERRWWQDDFGNAFLTRVPVRDWQSFILPTAPGRTARTAIRVTAVFGRTPVTIFVAHVGRQEDNDPQLTILADLFLAAPTPAVLMGDLNAHAGAAALERIRTAPGVIDVLRRDPGEPSRVTWMFVRGLEVLDSGRRDNGASDHSVVFAELEVP